MDAQFVAFLAGVGFSEAEHLSLTLKERRPIIAAHA